MPAPLVALWAAGCASVTTPSSVVATANPLPVASAPAAPVVPPGMFDQNGYVMAVKITGDASMSTNAGTNALAIDMAIPPRATLRTGKDSQLVVSFSNGASVQLGAETELIVEEFLQDPFAGTLRVADLVEEPSPSRTTLEFIRGEMVLAVKRLKVQRGAAFTIRTPAGWANVAADQGETTFRIAYRAQTQREAMKNILTITALTGRVTLQTPGGGQAEATPTSAILAPVDAP